VYEPKTDTREKYNIYDNIQGTLINKRIGMDVGNNATGIHVHLIVRSCINTYGSGVSRKFISPFALFFDLVPL
jgi:hypothetical protein